MQKKRLLLLACLPLLLGVAVAVAWSAREALRANWRCMARATVMSIEAALAAAYEADSQMVAPTGLCGSSCTEATLPPSEAGRIIAKLARAYPLDPPKAWDGTGPMIDPWGNRFVLYPCPTPGKHASRLHAASLGPDGVWGTPDDITALSVHHPSPMEP